MIQWEEPNLDGRFLNELCELPRHAGAESCPAAVDNQPLNWVAQPGSSGLPPSSRSTLDPPARGLVQEFFLLHMEGMHGQHLSTEIPVWASPSDRQP